MGAIWPYCLSLLQEQLIFNPQYTKMTPSTSQASRKGEKEGVKDTCSLHRLLNNRILLILAPSQRAVIARAVAAYTTRTCIRFTPRQHYDKDYIIISKIDGY